MDLGPIKKEPRASAKHILGNIIITSLVTQVSFSLQRYEYLVAVTISIGMFLFLFGSQETVGSKVRDGQVTTFSGFILLVG